MKTNHYKKKKLSKKKELVKRSASKYISFENRLSKETNKEIETKKLSDEQLIFNTFKDDKYWIVRKAVVEKLSDEKLIYSFKDDKYWDVRLAVIKKLSDEKLIYSFKDDKDWDVREAVVEKLEELKARWRSQLRT